MNWNSGREFEARTSVRPLNKKLRFLRGLKIVPTIKLKQFVILWKRLRLGNIDKDEPWSISTENSPKALSTIQSGSRFYIIGGQGYIHSHPPAISLSLSVYLSLSLSLIHANTNKCCLIAQNSSKSQRLRDVVSPKCMHLIAVDTNISELFIEDTWLEILLSVHRDAESFFLTGDESVFVWRARECEFAGLSWRDQQKSVLNCQNWTEVWKQVLAILQTNP